MSKPTAAHGWFAPRACSHHPWTHWGREEDWRLRKISSLSPSSGYNNTFACNNIHHRRSVQDNPWKHLSQVQHWFHTSWLDFPHLECHLHLAACLASLRLVRDLSKVFSLFTVHSINEKGQWLFPYGVAQSLTSLSGVSSKSKPIAIYLDILNLCGWSISYDQHPKLGSSLEVYMNSSKVWTGIKVCKLLWEASFPAIWGIWQIYPAFTHC